MERDMELKRTTSGQKLDLLGFVQYALHKWKIVAAAVLICLAAAFIYCYMLATPKYESTAQLYVVSSKDSVLNLSDLQIGSYLTSDYQLIFKTWEVNQMVIEQLNLPYTVEKLQKMVTVKNPSNTRALMISVRSPDAKEAAEIANKFAEVAADYIPMTMQSEIPTVFSKALEAKKPVSPNKALILSLTGAISLILALWALFVVYLIDDKVTTDEDIYKCIGRMPLTIIPYIDMNPEKSVKKRQKE